MTQAQAAAAIPRCRHGAILLGCADDDCPEQNAYLAQQNAALDRWYAREAAEARAVVREMLGLPPDDKPNEPPAEPPPHPDTMTEPPF